MEELKWIKFWRSFMEAGDDLEPEDYKAYMMGVLHYAFDGVVPELHGVAKSVFAAVKPNIDCSKKRTENGRKGGLKSAQMRFASSKLQADSEGTSEDASSTPSTNKKNKKKEKNKKNREDIYTSETEDIISYLNEKLGTSYRSTTPKTMSLVKARLSEGFTVEDFKKVIDVKYEEWKDDEKMSKFLRPETLFSNKFEGYLNQFVSNDEIKRNDDEERKRIERMYDDIFGV